ncbi:MAG: DUF2203 domain-containing protein [Bacteroidetes bacterium]|nr:DUF2203 domain-containing protein [Bacteroidota bacterium]
MTTEIKYFTPAEARNTLPLVKKIVKDILNTTREMRLQAEELDSRAEDDVKLKKMANDVEGFMSELEEIGCFFKDWNFMIGLVDFPAMIDGKEVYLCWKSDEDDIAYYHHSEEGFAGRKPIPKGYFEKG